MTEKRYKEVSEFDDDLIHITCPKCKYPMRVLAKDNKGIYQCYCASCGLDRFMKDTLDEDNLTFKEFNRCVERGKAIDIERLFDFIYEQHETIQEKQHTINEMAKALRTYDDGYIGLNKENQRLLKANMELTEENTNLLSTIRQAYQTERTTLGRNVLKQLLDNLE